MAGRTRTARLPDEPGGRCHLHHAVPDGRAGNHLGSRGRVASLDGKVWSAAGAVYGLEKRVRTGAYSERAVAWNAGSDAVWSHVRAVRDQDHRGWFAGGQGAGGAQSWHAPRSFSEEAQA